MRPRTACGIRHVLREAERVDQAVYAAIASTRTPTLDSWMRRLSRAADYSRLSLAAAALLATCGGTMGRRAAASGLSALGVTSAFVNLVVKPSSKRRRPDRGGAGIALSRRVRMPRSRSFPSGHTAGAVAFASGVARVSPALGWPLYSLAVLVGYSRVHTGVHFPGDVVGGALMGAILADFTASALPSSASAGSPPPGASDGGPDIAVTAAPEPLHLAQQRPPTQ